MTHGEAQARVEAALQAFLASDRYLLEHNLNERCISSRLAVHLQAAFSDLTVDVEYNRAGDLPKRLHLPDECANHIDEDGRALVVPDIIIHRRGPEGPNLLVVEVKKTSNPLGADCDRRRVHAFCEELSYSHGVLIECETRASREPTVRILEWIGE